MGVACTRDRIELPPEMLAPVSTGQQALRHRHGSPPSARPSTGCLDLPLPLPFPNAPPSFRTPNHGSNLQPTSHIPHPTSHSHPQPSPRCAGDAPHIHLLSSPQRPCPPSLPASPPLTPFPQSKPPFARILPWSSGHQTLSNPPRLVKTMNCASCKNKRRRQGRPSMRFSSMLPSQGRL